MIQIVKPMSTFLTNPIVGRLNNSNDSQHPIVSICTPTFNRRPFIPYLIHCVKHQTYPHDKIEWVIVDDGTDPIEELVKNIIFVSVKYIRIEEKMALGEKRNFMHKHCVGDIIVYMDDDDYYPPERVSHAVERLLQNSDVLIAGSSLMNIYFKDLGKMYEFGPYGPNHATAATFAFKRKLLNQTEYDKFKCIAEESQFLKNYTIPMVQLDPLKTILVFSHIHNSVNKQELLHQGDLSTNPYIRETTTSPSDFITEPILYSFYVDNMNSELGFYSPGSPENKPDVILNIANNKIKMYERQLGIANEQINSLSETNDLLRETNKRLTDRIRSMVSANIDKHKSEWTPR